jgi:hypothetical protein
MGGRCAVVGARRCVRLRKVAIVDGDADDAAALQREPKKEGPHAVADHPRAARHEDDDGHELVVVVDGGARRHVHVERVAHARPVSHALVHGLAARVRHRGRYEQRQEQRDESRQPNELPDPQERRAEKPEQLPREGVELARELADAARELPVELSEADDNGDLFHGMNEFGRR